MKSRYTREEFSWILYDVGNSAFVLVMVTSIMPIFFKDVASSGLPDVVSTANWGFANSTASFVLAILSPLLGVFADYQGRKMKFFKGFLSLGIICTLGLLMVGKGDWILCLFLFCLARIGWAGANLFYDAFIVDITTHDRMDKISASGYAWGYIGSVIPFLIIIGLILLSSGESEQMSSSAVKVGFLIVALWWFVFSLPAIRNIKQRHFLPNAVSSAKESFSRLFATFIRIKEHRQVFVFLGAYFFYIDGVGTIISMATVYGRELGFGAKFLIGVILFIQIVAFPSALVYGRLAARFSTKTMLLFGISVYGVITLLGFFLPAVGDIGIKTGLFWLMAFFVASSMGGIQALSRSYYGRLIPADRSAEFFGFYNVIGKFAAIAGPLMMGVVARLSGHSRWGVLSLCLLFVAGGILLARVKPARP